MRSIAMINQKGGVGKTTTAVNVAAGLTRWGSRVLLIDLDPQAHASLYLGVEAAPDEPGIYGLLVGENDARSAVRAIDDKLHLIAAHVDLVAAEPELAQLEERDTALKRGLAPIENDYDFIIIDCPPSLGLLTVNALAAVREVMIPLQTHFLALQGLGMLLQTATAVRDMLNPALRVSGVVLCMYDKGTRLAQEVDNDVREFIASGSPTDVWHGARVFDATVRRVIKLAECPSFGQTIFDYAPDSNGAADYASLAQEMLEMPMRPQPAVEARAAVESVPAEEIERPTVIAQASADAESVLPASGSMEEAATAAANEIEIATPVEPETTAT